MRPVQVGMAVAMREFILIIFFLTQARSAQEERRTLT